MSTAASGNKVKVHYTGTYDDGDVFDSSREAEPLEFEIGAGQVIPGFDRAVTGLAVGESVQIRLQEEEAYGPYNPEMIFDADAGQFEEGLIPEVGQQFQTQTEDGVPMLLTVKAIEGEKISLDANHPMAGKILNFAIELIEIV